jgi:hypothetical protein
MNKDSLLRATSSVNAKHGQLLNALQKKSDNQLYSLLATGANVAIGGGDPQDAVLRSVEDPDQLHRGVGDLGRRILYRWSRALYEFACSPSSADKATANQLIRAILGKGGGSAAAVTAILVGAFGLPPVTAAIVATLLIRIIVAPAADELCQAWSASLPRADRSSKPARRQGKTNQRRKSPRKGA